MNIEQVLAATSGMSAEDLEKLAAKVADQANAKRQPHIGNRAFTFVETYYDCVFPHQVFMQKELPTNERARDMKLEVMVLGISNDHASPATLEYVVHSAYGHPMAHVRFGKGCGLRSCHWDSNKGKWRLDPD